jgi:DNA-damage-inducible protein D
MKLKKLAESLEQTRQENGEEYWYARDLWQLLGYKTWRNFLNAISRAKESAQTTNIRLSDHFVGVSKMADIGLGSQREVSDYKLTRYACYLIAQNGDPRIPEIAFAQMYFTLQTRKQEILDQSIEEIERMISRKKLTETEKEFAKTITEHGVIDSKEIGEIKNAGDTALFGTTTSQMKKKLGLQNTTRPLADVLPTVTLKAKDLATEITTVNTKQKSLHGKNPIKYEHVNNNRNVREALTKSNIYPENLPPAEDIKKIESRHKQNKKLLEKETKRLKIKD